MNKKEILKRLAEIKAELATPEAKVDELETEFRDLETTLGEIEKREKILSDLEGMDLNPVEPEQRKAVELSKAEARGKALKENRAVTVGASDIVVPKHTSSSVAPTFQQVSSLIDLLNVEILPGGESYEKGYEKSVADGDYTAEGADYKEADVVFGYASIDKTKITAYSEESEEVVKLPAANYDAIVQAGISKSLRKKITKEVLLGDGTAGHFVGIFDDGATAIDPATDLSIAAIDQDTLDTIIFSYGGEESVEGDTAYLILNKADLLAFAKVKGSDNRRAYDIKLNGPTGSINGIPFVINSACKALSDTATAADAYCMAYGYLSNYTLALFSQAEVMRSTDFKFRQGMIAHKGSVFAGGNVTAHNGFLRIKKGGAYT